MVVNDRTLIRRSNDYRPEQLAETGDPAGLHIGTLDKPIENAMVTLNVRPKVVAETIEERADLIIAKHPPVLCPAKRLTTDNFQGEMYVDLLEHDIAVYAAHTNMDIIDNELNDWLYGLLGIKQTTFLIKTHTVPCRKLTVFASIDKVPQTREVLGLASAGSQGDYLKASYFLTGTGRFTLTQGTNPTIGETNQEGIVQEAKVEVIFPEAKQGQVLATMLQAYPYGEPTYDVYTIENQSKESGLGRVGVLDKPVRFSYFVQQIKEAFQLDGSRVIAKDDTKMIQRVAVCSGSGEKFYHDASRKQTDVYITGDVYYYAAHDMIAEGLPVIDPGHYIEAPCKPKLMELINQRRQENEWAASIFEPEANTNPFRFK